jgi:hypothetical protein
MTDSGIAYVVVDSSDTVVACYTIRKHALDHAWLRRGFVVAAPCVVDYRRDYRRKAQCKNCGKPLELSDDVWWHVPVEQRAIECLGPDGQRLGTYGEPERPYDEEADG